MQGHTHADIDSVFGKIWKYLRDELYILKSLERRGVNCNVRQCLLLNTLKLLLYTQVVDLFVVPDYKVLIDPFFDPKFTNYSKVENTQLQFTFEEIDVSPDFPTGVKVN